MTLTDKELAIVTRIAGDLEELYDRLSPLDVEIRERVWKALNFILDAQILIEDEIGELK